MKKEKSHVTDPERAARIREIAEEVRVYMFGDIANDRGLSPHEFEYFFTILKASMEHINGKPKF